MTSPTSMIAWFKLSSRNLEKFYYLFNNLDSINKEPGNVIARRISQKKNAANATRRIFPALGV